MLLLGSQITQNSFRYFVHNFPYCSAVRVRFGFQQFLQHGLRLRFVFVHIVHTGRSASRSPNSKLLFSMYLT